MVEISRKKPVLKNREDEKAERAVLDFTMERPAYSQHRVSNERRKQIIFVITQLWNGGQLARRIRSSTPVRGISI